MTPAQVGPSSGAPAIGEVGGRGVAPPPGGHARSLPAAKFALLVGASGVDTRVGRPLARPSPTALTTIRHLTDLRRPAWTQTAPTRPATTGDGPAGLARCWPPSTVPTSP